MEASNQSIVEAIKRLGTYNDTHTMAVRPTVEVPEPEPIKRVKMSGLLNVIDGAASVEGRLLIVTTNHPDKLDGALK